MCLSLFCLAHYLISLTHTSLSNLACDVNRSLVTENLHHSETNNFIMQNHIYKVPKNDWILFLLMLCLTFVIQKQL